MLSVQTREDLRQRQARLLVGRGQPQRPNILSRKRTVCQDFFAFFAFSLHSVNDLLFRYKIILKTILSQKSERKTHR